MNTTLTTRRKLLGWSSTLALAFTPLSKLAHAHSEFGLVRPPQPSPALWLVKDDGSTTDLHKHLQGHVSAVQLVFTKCRATCPIQAALFSDVARKLRVPDAQLLSVSIDPAIDKPSALRAWLDGFKAPPLWRAAAPRLQDVDALLDFFRGRSQGADRHSSQVFLVDREGKLVLRTTAMPLASMVLESLEAIAKNS